MTDHPMDSSLLGGASRLVARMTQIIAVAYSAGFADATVGDGAADDMNGYGRDRGAGDAAVGSVYK